MNDKPKDIKKSQYSMINETAAGISALNIKLPKAAPSKMIKLETVVFNTCLEKEHNLCGR